MFKIVRTESSLSPVTLPLEKLGGTRHRQGGAGLATSLIVRTETASERVPLTIADFDRLGRYITLVIPGRGKTTTALPWVLKEGEYLDDLAARGLHARHFD